VTHNPCHDLNIINTHVHRVLDKRVFASLEAKHITKHRSPTPTSPPSHPVP
jgi:hypothetical protein